MKRSLILVTVLALSLAAAPAADAVAPRKLNVGTKWGFTTGNGYAYWIKDGRRVMRTDLTTNAVSQLSSFPPHRDVWSMHAGGGFVSLSIHSRKSGVSEIRRIDSNGVSEMLAKAVFHVKSRRHCGAFLLDGPVTDAGESTWQRWTGHPVGGRRRCGEATPKTKITARTFSRPAGGSAQVMLPDVTRRIYDLGTDGLLSDSRVPQVEQNFAIEVVSAFTFRLINRATRKVVYRSNQDDSASVVGTSLAPDGSFIYDAYSDEAAAFKTETAPKLVLATGTSRVLTPNNPAADATRALFCGSRIAQVDSWTGTDGSGDVPQFSVWSRNLDGSSPVQIATETELPHKVPSRVECDGNHLAMELESDGVRGSSRYVLDLP